MTTSTGRPAMPPAAFTSSRAIRMPAWCCSPNSAKRPVMLVITPMRTGSWAIATPAKRTARTAATRETMVPSLSRRGSLLVVRRGEGHHASPRPDVRGSRGATKLSGRVRRAVRLRLTAQWPHGGAARRGRDVSPMLLTMLGGRALFLLGVTRVSEALEPAAGPTARRWMAAATGSPVRALGTATAVGAMTQSGTALCVTALTMVATGLVSPASGLAMSLGAKLGATGAIQLAAFNVSEYALPLVGVGFFLSLWQRARALGGMLLGVGLLFLGLDLTVRAIEGLAESEVFTLVIHAAERQPLSLLLVGVVLGAVLASSNAGAAVAIGLVVSGAISLPTAFALVAGGNLGGTFLPLVVSRGLDSGAQRVAVSHVLVMGLAGVIAVFAARPAMELIALLGGDGARQVANAHTFYNLVVAIVATVFAGPVTRLVAQAVPTSEDDSTPKYLRREALDDPALAIKLALRETVRISDQVQVMTELAVRNLSSGKWDPGPIEGREAKTDRLTREVVDYLA